MSDATEDAIRRADRAQALLDDEVLGGAFSAIEAHWLSEWRNSPARDKEGREGLFVMLRALDALRGELRAYVENGKVARKRLDDDKADRALRELHGL